MSKQIVRKKIEQLENNTDYIGCSIHLKNKARKVENCFFSECTFHGKEICLGIVIDCIFEICCFTSLHIFSVSGVLFEKCTVNELVVVGDEIKITEDNTINSLDLMCESKINWEQIENLEALCSFSFYLDFQKTQAERYKEFVHITNLQNLTCLQIKGALEDEWLEYLKKLENLSELNFSPSRIKGHGLVYLKNLQQLTSLDLSNTDIENDSLVHIQNLKKLSYLNLSATDISDEDLSHLANLQSLSDLNLHATKILGQGLANLISLKNICEAAILK